MPLKPYRYYLRQHWRLITFGLISLVLTNGLDVISPWFLGQAIDQITQGRDPLRVAQTVGVLIAISLGLAAARFLWRYFWMQFHHAVADDLRQRVFAKMMELGPSFYHRQTTGDLMSLINNDVNTFRMAIGPGILILVDGLLLLIFIPFLMWKISPSWTLQCMILLPLVPFVSMYMLRKTKTSYDLRQSTYAKMSGFAQELVGGLRVIKSYAQERRQSELFALPSKEYQGACNAADATDSVFGPVLEIFAAVGAVILLFLGARDLVTGVVSVGAFFALFQYVQRMVWPLEAIGVALGHFQTGNSAYRRILKLLLTQTDMPASGPQTLEAFESLEVRELDFTYGDETGAPRVLKGISFFLNRGEILGIVGLTGSGKTTLIEILSGLYQGPKNTLFINGVAVEHLSQQYLRRLITVAHQEPFLFSRSIADNILLGLEGVGWNDIAWCTKTVRIHDEIMGLSNKEQTLLGERGVNLSGGQRQRLALARALARQSPITIIDDSLSAVDTKTEAEILQGLRNELSSKADRAAIVITHRLSALKWVDKVLVLNNGRVEAVGSPEEIETLSPTFARLRSLQDQTNHLIEVDSDCAANSSGTKESPL